MAIVLKVNKVNLFVSSVLFVFWYHSPNFLDTPRTCILHQWNNILKNQFYVLVTLFILSSNVGTLRIFKIIFYVLFRYL
jgi:hypothetical protein